MTMCASCETQRIEYHKRPAFYERAAGGNLPSEVTMEDGTIIRYGSPTAQSSSLGRSNGSKPFQLREEAEDGTVTMQCLVPEHVLVNTLTCLRNEEYQLLWDQLLATQARERYEESGEGETEMASSMRKWRHDLIATLNRMIAGIPHQETKFTNMGEGVTRCQLRPQVAEPYRFKTVDVVKEGVDLKLLYIK